jgi:anti-sigma-K factor RskA
MICEMHEKYELGDLSEVEFQKHKASCSTCQTIMQKDRELLGLAAELRQPVEAPGLWDQIEDALIAEKGRKASILTGVIARHRTAALALAASLILAVGLSLYLSNQEKKEDPSGLLTSRLLEQVIEKEQAYDNAIEQLEEVAQSQLVSMDTDLMLLYRDRLETIDAQIVRCRTALENNPANAHIRRYLLIALQDKRETLEEVLAYESIAL